MHPCGTLDWQSVVLADVLSVRINITIILSVALSNSGIEEVDRCSFKLRVLSMYFCDLLCYCHYIFMLFIKYIAN